MLRPQAATATQIPSERTPATLARAGIDAPGARRSTARLAQNSKSARLIRPAATRVAFSGNAGWGERGPAPAENSTQPVTAMPASATTAKLRARASRHAGEVAANPP